MGIAQTISRYYVGSKRLLFKQTRKPSKKEYSITSRIVALGILVIGAIGFIIDLIVNFIVTITQA